MKRPQVDRSGQVGKTMTDESSNARKVAQYFKMIMAFSKRAIREAGKKGRRPFLFLFFVHLDVTRLNQTLAFVL